MLNGKKKKEIEVHRSMGGYKVEARKEEKKKKNSHVDFQLTTRLIYFIVLSKKGQNLVKARKRARKDGLCHDRQQS